MLLSPPLESYLKFNLAFASLVLAYASISACKGLAPFTFPCPAGSQEKPENHHDANWQISFLSATRMCKETRQVKTFLCKFISLLRLAGTCSVAACKVIFRVNLIK